MVYGDRWRIEILHTAPESQVQLLSFSKIELQEDGSMSKLLEPGTDHIGIEADDLMSTVADPETGLEARTQIRNGIGAKEDL